MLSIASMRYARALVDVVAAPGSGIDTTQVLDQLHAINATIQDSADLRNALLSPAVSPSRKRAVMERILAPMAVLRQVRNFLFVVIDHRRIHELSSTVEAFDLLLDQRLGYVRADVSSAQPLTAEQRTGLESELSRLAGKKAKLRFATDPALLAGVIARVGSTVYDGSVRGQLDRMRARLGRG